MAFIMIQLTIRAIAVQVGNLEKDIMFSHGHDWTSEITDAGYIVPLDKYLLIETISDLKLQFLASFLRVKALATYLYETTTGVTVFWSDFAARTILFAIPIIIIYIVAQKYIGEAMTYGAVKG